MDILSRLKEIIAFSGLSVRAFAMKCGIPQKTLDNQVKGLRGISLETIISVAHTFPEISSEWLLRGDGEMLKSEPIDANADRVIKLVDTITMQQDTISEKTKEIADLKERVRQLEVQLNKKY